MQCGYNEADNRYFPLQRLLQCLDGMAIYTSVPAHLQHVAATLLADSHWLDTCFFPTNLERLRRLYDYTTARLFKELGIKSFQAEVNTIVQILNIYSSFLMCRLDCLCGLTSVLIWRPPPKQQSLQSSENSLLITRF